MFTAENLTCLREKTMVFRGLGFCLEEGSLLLLKGPNGSGKTSLIEILAGVLTPGSGEVLWDGRPIAGNKDFQSEVMMIGHQDDANVNASVAKNLMIAAKRYGTEMLVPAALRFYDLEAFKDTPLRQLSAGWRRKAALARLIVAPCKLWLLDEPTDFLDEQTVALTASLIETRVAQGGIVIAASHSMNSAVAAHVLEMGDFTPNPKK